MQFLCHLCHLFIIKFIIKCKIYDFSYLFKKIDVFIYLYVYMFKYFLGDT